MNSELNKSALCYIGYIENNPVVFFAVLHFPHHYVRNFKRGHRLVVLPDYQGLGIGHIFSTMIADMFKKQGFRFIITSSTKALFKQRSEDPRWIVTRKGRSGKSTGILSKTLTINKLTYDYEYVGENPSERAKIDFNDIPE